MSSQVKKRRLNRTLLTISKFAFPEHLIKSLAQCNISLILRALHKLLQFILTRTPQTLLLWSRITLVWRSSHVLLIPSWLLWSTTMATKQGTTNSMTLKTQTRYVLYNYLLQYRSMFGCYGRRRDLSKWVHDHYSLGCTTIIVTTYYMSLGITFSKHYVKQQHILC